MADTTKRGKAAGARSTGQDGADHGPATLRARGEVVVADAADPDAPNRTIRRARRVWAPDILRAQGALTEAQWMAAARYHDAFAVGVMGASEGRLDVYVDGRAVGAGPSARQLDAARDYRQATRAAGMAASPILVWCVLGHGTVAGYAATRGWDSRKATGYLCAALDRLAEHWGLQ